jgi:LAS superfamily LD-carboxypeptidase LdcB
VLGSFLARRLLPVAGAAAWLFFAPPAGGVNVQQLTPAEVGTLQDILAALEPVIGARKPDGSANILTWQELYEPLTDAQRAFLDAFRAMDAKALGATSHHFGELPAAPDIAPVGRQQVIKDGAAKPLDPQFLPRNVLAAYRRMMEAMQADLGRQLLVESGYRSPAYQLYLFLYYMPKHGHSVIETNRFVALPGHSEHGYPPRQAIDFINEAGINGEDHPEEFEALPEYAWLQRRAKEFGFALSYPRGNAYNTAFEPWHWRYEAPHE